MRLKKFSISFLTICLLLLVGCSEKDSKQILQEKHLETMVMDLTESHLKHLPMEEVREIHENYRTSMTYEIWEMQFNLDYGIPQSNVLIAEQFNLVPIDYSILHTSHEKTDKGNTYIIVADLLATSSIGLDSLTNENKETIRVYFSYHFDKEGILDDYILKIDDQVEEGDSVEE